MEYKTLKEKEKRPVGYEYSDKGRNNWELGMDYLVGEEITDIDLIGHDYRVPVIPRTVKIERTPNRTYTVSAIAEAQKSAAEIRKLCKKISDISAEIDKILEGRRL
jgi:hypothetical protein